MEVKRVGILYHPGLSQAQALAQDLYHSLKPEQATCWLCSAWEEEEARRQVVGTDLLVSLGGDGTILRAARIALAEGTPILGVRLGRVGFLTEVDPHDVGRRVSGFLDGEGWVEERMMLQVNSPSWGREYHALNDVVVGRGALPRTISIQATIDGEFFASYTADGLVIATPTGSTGYSLAAGGPVVHPQALSILLTPISPHLSPSYPLVLPPSVTLELKVRTAQQAALSVDGQVDMALRNGDSVVVRRSPKVAHFLRFGPQSDFYAALAQRLRCKEQDR
jgi:NAD+ kinase